MARSLSQYLAVDHGFSVHPAAKAFHAPSDGRTIGDATEGDEIHDAFHGLFIF